MKIPWCRILGAFILPQRGALPITNDLAQHAFTITYIALGTAFVLLLVLVGMILVLRRGLVQLVSFASGRSSDQCGDSRDRALAGAVAVTTLIEQQKFSKTVMDDGTNTS